MKILKARPHGVLDYLTVLVFLLAPTLFGLTGLPATLAYSLAGIHLLLTLITAFPLGIIKVIPFRIHGVIEFLVAVALVLSPWLLGFAAGTVARTFYLTAGIVIFLVWLLMDYYSAEY